MGGGVAFAEFMEVKRGIGTGVVGFVGVFRNDHSIVCLWKEERVKPCGYIFLYFFKEVNFDGYVLYMWYCKFTR